MYITQHFISWRSSYEAMYVSIFRTYIIELTILYLKSPQNFTL